MSPAAPANVHIKDRTHAGMQAVPALLASLHGLSGHDDAKDARAREEQAERDYQRSQARQRPAAGPAAATTTPAASSPARPVVKYKYNVHACIAATSAEILTMIAQSEAKTRRLQEDLDTKRKEEDAGP